MRQLITIYLFITPLRQHDKIEECKTHTNHARYKPQIKTTNMHPTMP